jgi:hypothetical protein
MVSAYGVIEKLYLVLLKALNMSLLGEQLLANVTSLRPKVCGQSSGASVMFKLGGFVKLSAGIEMFFNTIQTHAV